jgi:hypothetical protein
VVSPIACRRGSAAVSAGRIPAPASCTSAVRIRIPSATPVTAVVADTAVSPAASVVSAAVGDAALLTPSGRLLLALLAALDDVLDAHAAPRKAGGRVPVLQVAWVGMRVSIAGGGLVLALPEGFLACDLGLFACVGERQGRVRVHREVNLGDNGGRNGSQACEERWDGAGLCGGGPMRQEDSSW